MFTDVASVNCAKKKLNIQLFQRSDRSPFPFSFHFRSPTKVAVPINSFETGTLEERLNNSRCDRRCRPTQKYFMQKLPIEPNIITKFETDSILLTPSKVL